MDRDERLQCTAAIIAAGLCASQPLVESRDSQEELADTALAIALRIEAAGYGGYEPAHDVALRIAQCRSRQ
jgi:hypothetical protein